MFIAIDDDYIDGWVNANAIVTVRASGASTTVVAILQDGSKCRLDRAEFDAANNAERVVPAQLKQVAVIVSVSLDEESPNGLHHTIQYVPVIGWQLEDGFGVHATWARPVLPVPVYKADTIWTKIGLLMATGEIVEDELLYGGTNEFVETALEEAPKILGGRKARKATDTPQP